MHSFILVASRWQNGVWCREVQGWDICQWPVSIHSTSLLHIIALNGILLGSIFQYLSWSCQNVCCLYTRYWCNRGKPKKGRPAPREVKRMRPSEQDYDYEDDPDLTSWCFFVLTVGISRMLLLPSSYPGNHNPWTISLGMWACCNYADWVTSIWF